jgi:hypothetical protein
MSIGWDRHQLGLGFGEEVSQRLEDVLDQVPRAVRKALSRRLLLVRQRTTHDEDVILGGQPVTLFACPSASDTLNIVTDSPSIIPPGGRLLSDEERMELMEEMAEIISKSHLFKTLDEEGRRRVLTSGFVCSYNAGDIVLKEGDPGDTMYLVLDGKARVSTGKVHLAELTRGACLGEVSVLTGGVRTASVVAETELDLVAFEAHRIERVLADYPKVREVLESIVEGRARHTVEKIIGS